MQYLDSSKLIRFDKAQLEAIDKIVSDKNEKYDNASHFVRCAINILIRIEEAKCSKAVNALIRGSRP